MGAVEAYQKQLDEQKQIMSLSRQVAVNASLSKLPSQIASVNSHQFSMVSKTQFEKQTMGRTAVQFTRPLIYQAHHKYSSNQSNFFCGSVVRQTTLKTHNIKDIDISFSKSMNSKISAWHNLRELKALEDRINRLEKRLISYEFSNSASIGEVVTENFALLSHRLEKRVLFFDDEAKDRLRKLVLEVATNAETYFGYLQGTVQANEKSQNEVKSLIKSLNRQRIHVLRKVHLLCRRIDIRNGIQKLLKFHFYNHQLSEEEISFNLLTGNYLILNELKPYKNETNRKNKMYRFAA